MGGRRTQTQRPLRPAPEHHSCVAHSLRHLQREEFLAAIGNKETPNEAKPAAYDPYRAVLDQVLELDPKEFEILVGHLLTALGFEGSEVTGKTGDGGVDATGELNIANLAKVKVFVQAKRYKLDAKISANVVKQLRAAIPSSGQGAFITAADFQSAATDVALQPGVPAHRSRERSTARRSACGALGRHPTRVPGTPRTQTWAGPSMKVVFLADTIRWTSNSKPARSPRRAIWTRTRCSISTRTASICAVTIEHATERTGIPTFTYLQLAA